MTFPEDFDCREKYQAEAAGETVLSLQYDGADVLGQWVKQFLTLLRPEPDFVIRRYGSLLPQAVTDAPHLDVRMPKDGPSQPGLAVAVAMQWQQGFYTRTVFFDLLRLFITVPTRLGGLACIQIVSYDIYELESVAAEDGPRELVYSDPTLRGELCGLMRAELGAKLINDAKEPAHIAALRAWLNTPPPTRPGPKGGEKSERLAFVYANAHRPRGMSIPNFCSKALLDGRTLTAYCDEITMAMGGKEMERWEELPNDLMQKLPLRHLRLDTIIESG